MEPYRPQFHFSPAQGWMNDPNGMVYFAGEYHLFYQHNPDDTVWGPMHWGHAVSRDLVNWQHLPIALYPDANGAIFSGSAVIDENDSAGFGKQAMVAVFTHDFTHDISEEQMQSVAYSNDRGRTFTKFAGNPVLKAPNQLGDFRDPKVIWYEEGNGAGHWVMILAAGNVILFYSSSDLTDWEATGEFGLGYGAHEGVWETPDLFQLAVDDSEEERWVLSVGVQAGAPASGSGTQYFVGDFDGKTFSSENPESTVLWADYGADFYAAQAWNDAPNSRHVWAAWMNNWQYANAIPAATARGSLTVPREMSLTKTAQGIRLRQVPVAELQTLRTESQQWHDVVIPAQAKLLDGDAGDLLEIRAEFAVIPGMSADRLGLQIRTSRQGNEYTRIGYVVESRQLFVDRMRSGAVDFSADFLGVHMAEVQPIDGVVRLHIFVDRTSVEVFANDGLVVFSDLIFPDDAGVGVELFADGGEATLNELEIFKLRPATVTAVP